MRYVEPILWPLAGVLGAALLLALIVMVVQAAIKSVRREIVIHSFEAGLRYRDGVFDRVLAPGRYVTWTDRVTCETIDLREVTKTIGGQEVLTSDRLSVKLTVLLVHAVADARRAYEVAQNLDGDIHAFGQAALRSAVMRRTLDEVLTSRRELADEVRAELAPLLETRGVNLVSLDLRDVMLSAELKRAYSEMFRIKKENEAALERARGETAALRGLANAARMMKDNPALGHLRLLQVAHASAQKGASIVLNASLDGGGTMQNPHLKSVPQSDDPPSSPGRDAE